MKRHDYLHAVFIVSLTVLLGVGFIQLGLQNISPVWNSGIANQITLVIMIAFIIIWLLSWVIWDAFESEEVDNQFGNQITKPLKLGSYAIGILIAMAFAGMVCSIGNIAIFIPLMGAVVLIASIGDHIVIRNLTRMVKMRDSDADPKLINYYINHPHMLLHCFHLFLLAVSTATYLFLIRTREPGNEWIAYIVLSVSILVNESVIWRWRWERVRQKG
jgi:hypothetical protein